LRLETPHASGLTSGITRRPSVPEKSKEPVIAGASSELPFSRGILARSLLRCGLDPVTAYTVALQIQSSLTQPRYTKEELREMVSKTLDKDQHPEIAKRYRERTARPDVIVIKGDTGMPFSKGLLAHSLMVTAIDYASALSISRRIQNRLRRESIDEIRLKDLRSRIYEELMEKQGETAARRYTTWRRMVASDYPLVVLIGGPTGAGKSTLALELATRMEITQVVSTDTIREMLRTMFSVKLLPAVHKSSYLAGRKLRLPPGSETDEVLVGYHQQSLLVNVGVEAMIKRAIQENVDLIINGVHLVPGFIDPADFPESCIVQFVVTVSDTQEHTQRFLSRQRSARRRKAKAYRQNFKNICKIRDYVTECARQAHVPIIDNLEIEESAQDALSYFFDGVESCGLLKTSGKRTQAKKENGPRKGKKGSRTD
jgi:2-phosphoglycerate kinase